MAKKPQKLAETWEIEKDKRKSEMKVIKGKPQVTATVVSSRTIKPTPSKKVTKKKVK